MIKHLIGQLKEIHPHYTGLIVCDNTVGFKTMVPWSGCRDEKYLDDFEKGGLTYNILIKIREKFESL